MSNTNSSRSFMNRLKRNPAAAFGILIAIVGIAALVWFFVFRGKKGAKGPSKPQITITGMKMSLKPDKSNVEEYRMYEYSKGSKGSQLATNIDLVLSWTNGAGFNTNNVEKLIFKRFIRALDATDNSSDILVEDSPHTEDTVDIGDFDIGQVTILGNKLKTSYKDGKNLTKEDGYTNIIKIYYVTDGSEKPLAETNTIDISNNDLQRTLVIDSTETVTISVSRGTSALNLATANPNMFYKIFSVPGAETPALKLSSVNSTSGQVKFTKDNVAYNFEIAELNSSNPFYVFEKITATGDDLFLKVVGDTTDRYVIGESGGNFALMTFDDIKRTGANFINARVRIVGNTNKDAIAKPSDMSTTTTTPTTTGFVYENQAVAGTPATGILMNIGAGDSVDACRVIARDKNIPAFGFRNSNADAYPNTCWGLTDLTNGRLTPYDNVSVACTMEDDDIADMICDKPVPTYSDKHVSGITGYANFGDANVTDIEGCRKLAKTGQLSYKAIGFRSSANSPGEKCWGVTGDAGTIADYTGTSVTCTYGGDINNSGVSGCESKPA